MSLFFNVLKLSRQVLQIKRAWDSRACNNIPTPPPSPEPSPSPLPPTVPVRGIIFKWNTLRKLARGSDNHAATVGRNGVTYLVWGDGFGFAEKGPKHSLGISKHVGNKFIDVGTGNGKCYGILALGNTLYLWRGPGSMEQSIRQTDMEEWDILSNGKVKFKRRVNFWNFNRGIAHPTFIQHGPNNQWAKDGWIYSLSTRFSKIKFEIQEGPGGVEDCDVWLFKQPIGQLMNPYEVRYFAGLTGGVPSWTQDIKSMVPVATMHKSFLISCAYIKSLNRYMLWNSFDWRAGDPFRSDLQVWDAEFPWGPWRKVGHWINWGRGYVYPSAFYWNIDPATIAQDGKRMKLIFSGGGHLDAYHDMEIKLVT